MSVTAVQISERRQKVKTTVSDESIKMRKFISMTMTMLKIGFIGFGGGSALIPVIEDEVVEKDKIVSEEDRNLVRDAAQRTQMLFTVRIVMEKLCH